jgi:hypothetical protein
MLITNHHPTYGVWSVQEDRDLSRAAAERHFLLQAAAEQRGTPARSWLRRLLTDAPTAVVPGRAEA